MKKILAIALAAIMLLALAVPAMAAKASAEPANDCWIEGVGFHCTCTGGNGKVGEMKKVSVYFTRIDDTTWLYDNEVNGEFACPKCGNTDWASYSNKSGVPNGKNIQVNPYVVPGEVISETSFVVMYSTGYWVTDIAKDSWDSQFDEKFDIPTFYDEDGWQLVDSIAEYIWDKEDYNFSNEADIANFTFNYDLQGDGNWTITDVLDFNIAADNQFKLEIVGTDYVYTSDEYNADYYHVGDWTTNWHTLYTISGAEFEAALQAAADTGTVTLKITAYNAHDNDGQHGGTYQNNPCMLIFSGGFAYDYDVNP